MAAAARPMRFEFDDLEIEDGALIISAEDEAESDADAQVAPAEPSVPESQHLEQIEAVRAEAEQVGYERGRTEAQAAATQGIEARSTLALEAIARDLGALLSGAEATAKSAQTEALTVAMAAVAKLMPEHAARGALTEIEGLIRETLAERSAEPRIVIRLPDALLDSLAERIETLSRKSGFEGRAVLLADPALGPADCLIEWANGGVERRPGALLTEVEGLVARATAPSPTPAAPTTSPQPRAAEPYAEPDPAPHATTALDI